MGQSLAIPRVIPNDWKRLDLIVSKIKMRLGSAASPTFAGITITGLTASSLVGTNASKALESVTVGTGLDYTRPNLTLSHLGIEALTDPGADKILFWDDTASACKWLGMGNSIAITDVTLDTIQDIRTTASPTFANLSLGTGELTTGSINRGAGTLTLEIAGTAEISISSTTITLGGNLVIPDTGYIGSTSDTNAIQIAASGEVSFTDVVTGILPTAGAHLATKEYVDLAIGASADFFLSDNDDAIIADYHILYETDTGEASSTLVTDPMAENDDQLMFSYITASGVPGVEYLRAGVYILHAHLSRGTGDKPTTFYWTLSKYTIGDVETVILTSEESSAIPDSTISFQTHATLAADTAILDTDRLVLKIYANVGAAGGNSEVTIHMEGTHDCHLTNQLPSSIWQNQGDVLDDLNTLGVVGADGEFLVGTGAGALAWEGGATARTSIGLGTGDSPTFSNLTLGATGTGELTCGSINKAANTLTLEIAGTPVISVLSTHVTISATLYVTSGSVNTGVADTTAGQWVCYGGASGTYGGRSYFHTNADADDVIDFFHVRVEGDDLHIGDDANGDKISLIGPTSYVKLADGAVMATSGAPTTDAMIANKKYVDDVHAGAPAAHVHDGDTLQLDAINSDAGGGFSFTTASTVTFSEAITMSAGKDLTIAGHVIFNTNNSYIGFTNPRITFNDTSDQAEVTGALTVSSIALVSGASVTVGKASTTTGTIVLHDSNSANTITLTVPDISAGSLSFTLPPTDGDNTNVLQTDGNGVLTWVAAGSSGTEYVDRGDPAAWDFDIGDFTTDGTWNDLDLSAIVPAGAIAVHLLIAIRDDVTGSEMQFRKNGNSNAYNAARVGTQAANVTAREDLIVSCDTDRVVEYMGSNLAFINIFFLVKGWWI